MTETFYTKDHEWIRIEDGIAIVGISAYAAEQLGDIVYVDLPEKGKTLARRDEAAVVESVKAASEVYAPVGGEVIAINEALHDDPEMVNRDPEGEGWFLKIRVGDGENEDALMSAENYQRFIKEEG